MMIIKADGERVQFRPDKIVETLRRIGAKDELVNHVVQKVTAGVKDGMTTKEVYAIVRKELHKENRCIAHRYNLRSGLLRLGPAGFKFEKYVASILQAYDYKTELPDKELPGLCVMHEVDVVARTPSRTIMIEAKFRNRFDDTVNLKDTMATWARLIDLREGSKAGKNCPFFDEAWIVTNGRFSDRAHQFGVCKGIQMIGWSQTEQSLARMVDHAALYPITVIDSLHQWELEKFSEKNIMLCRELTSKRPAPLAQGTGIPLNRMKSIIDTCKEIVETS
ncbi:MAG: hypothetical protein RL272_156, partial [Candidatus Parcubacteria bacterium]